jgi:phosphoribosylformylglycinamidine synthase
MIGGLLGADINLDDLVPQVGFLPEILMFCETPSRFLVSVSPENRRVFEKYLDDSRYCRIGRVKAEKELAIRKNGRAVCRVSLDSLFECWNIMNEAAK